MSWSTRVPNTTGCRPTSLSDWDRAGPRREIRDGRRASDRARGRLRDDLREWSPSPTIVVSPAKAHGAARRVRARGLICGPINEKSLSQDPARRRSSRPDSDEAPLSRRAACRIRPPVGQTMVPSSGSTATDAKSSYPSAAARRSGREEPSHVDLSPSPVVKLQSKTKAQRFTSTISTTPPPIPVARSARGEPARAAVPVALQLARRLVHSITRASTREEVAREQARRMDCDSRSDRSTAHESAEDGGTEHRIVIPKNADARHVGMLRVLGS